MVKSQKESKNLTIVIFPYLFVSKELTIDAITIKPSFANIIEQEEPAIKEQLLTVARFFRYSYDKQINLWSYYVTHLSCKKDWELLRKRLNKFTTILRYSKLSDFPNNALFSHFDYFVFEIGKLQLDKKSDFRYYEGLLNGENTIEVCINKDKIEKPFSFHYEIHPLKLEDIENDKFLQSFYYSDFNIQEEKRLHKAMEWFNRSFATTKEVDTADEIIHLETAFEALFKTTSDGIKAQVKSGISNFIGESTELSEWVDQFWKLRNAIVHGDKELPPFLFKHRKGTKGHRHHVNLGRKIFTKCVDAYLKLRISTYTGDIHEELISNEVRLKEAAKILKKNKKTSLRQAFRLVSDFREDDLSASKKQVTDFGKIFLPFVIEDLKNEKKEKIIEEIKKVLKWKGSKYSDLAILYNKALEKYQEFYFSHSYSIPNLSLAISSLRNAGHTFIKFAKWRFLTFYD